MKTPYQQFRNKDEAQQAILDMEQRKAKAELRGSGVYDPKRAAFYAAEAARIRALLPTLPD